MRGLQRTGRLATSALGVTAVLLFGACSAADGGDVDVAVATSTPPTVPETVAPTSSTTTTTAPTTTTTEATTTTAPPNFADTYELAASGVFRVDATFCSGFGSQGTAFRVADDLILSAAHVTSDADTASLSRDDGTRFDAEVVAIDYLADLVLLRVDEGLDGHVFEVGDDGIRVGDEVAALGHPSGLPLTFTSGRLSRIGAYSGDVRNHQTDTPINPGNSGGPLIDESGRVLGVASWKLFDTEGLSFVVAADEVVAFVEAQPSADLEFVGCRQFELDPTDLVAVVETRFVEYFDLINAGREGDAFDGYLSERLTDVQSRDQFVLDHSTTIISNLEVWSVWEIDEATAGALVAFRSEQAAEFGFEGQTCTDWSLSYRLIASDNGWLIDSATNEPGSPAACPD